VTTLQTALRTRRSAGPAAGTGVGARWFRDPYRLSLFLLLFMSISRLHQYFEAVGKMRPGLVLVAAALIAAMANPRALAPARWMRTWPARTVAALGALAVIGAPFGISLGAAASYFLGYYVKVLVFAFLLMAAMRGTRDLAGFCWAYVAACAVLIWMAMFVFDLSLTDQGVARLGGLYTWDANDLGCVLLLGLPLTGLMFQASRGLPRLLAGLVIVGTGVALARSGSRGAFVGIVVIGLAYLIALRQVSVFRRVSFVVIVGAALAVAAPQGYWRQMSTLTSVTEDYNWTAEGGRKKLAEDALGFMASHPVFGVGVGLFGRAEGMISERASEWSPGMRGVRWVAPHNSYLEAGSELGVPGLLLWTTLVIGCIAGPARLRRQMPAGWAQGGREERFLYQAGLYLPLAALGFGVTAAFVSFAWLDPLYVLAAFNVGFSTAVRTKLRATGTGPASSAPRIPRYPRWLH
jgi:hypothetical protein